MNSVVTGPMAFYPKPIQPVKIVPIEGPRWIRVGSSHFVNARFVHEVIFGESHSQEFATVVMEDGKHFDIHAQEAVAQLKSSFGMF